MKREYVVNAPGNVVVHVAATDVAVIGPEEFRVYQ